MPDKSLLQHSPLDASPPTSLVQIGQTRNRTASRWTPSRFTVRAVTEDGRLILWNSYSGSLSVFEAEHRQAVEELLRRSGCEAQSAGLAAYLKDRGFLVAEGTDELRRVQYASGRDRHRSDVLELILLASEDCNFRCTYCYEDFDRGTMLPAVRRGVQRLVERRLPRLRDLRVSWFGGEPLYGFAAVEELAPRLSRMAADAGVGYHSHMTTNGYLLTPEVARKLVEWRVRDFQITLDGPGELHDPKRPTRDGGPSFATIFENLEALHAGDLDFAVTVRMNFDRENHAALEDLLDLLDRRFGADPRFTVSFHAVGRWGGSNDADLAVCGADESDQVAERLKRAARERGIPVSGDLKDVGGPGAQVCYAARPYNLVVGADGRLMKCTVVLDKEDHNVVGRLGEDGEVELDDDKMALWTEPAFESDSTCQRCVVLPTCQGIHCPWIRIQQGRRPCPSLRLNLKREMRRSLETNRDDARRVRVGAS